jgi:hypothetical protein
MIPGNLLGHWIFWTSIVFALCNAGQVLLMVGLIERYFGSAFSLDSLRQVLGLVAAAIAGTAVAAIGGTLGIVLVQGSTAPALTIWYHWLTSNVPGIVAVAPLLIGLAASVRDPPPRSEMIESVVGACGTNRIERTYRFLAAGALGNRGGRRPAVPITAMACSPLQAGLRGGRRLHRCPGNRLDDNVQRWHVR